jgi:hypothetical protein
LKDDFSPPSQARVRSYSQPWCEPHNAQPGLLIFSIGGISVQAPHWSGFVAAIWPLACEVYTKSKYTDAPLAIGEGGKYVV